jgi:hypothetical protein
MQSKIHNAIQHGRLENDIMISDSDPRNLSGHVKSQQLEWILITLSGCTEAQCFMTSKKGSAGISIE